MAGTRGVPARRAAIGSPWLLRAIASGMTLLSFGAMTYFAAGHMQESDAPLKPSAPAAVLAASAPVPTPAARSRFTSPAATPAPAAANGGRSFVSPQVPTTPRAPVTRTRQSGR